MCVPGSWSGGPPQWYGTPGTPASLQTSTICMLFTAFQRQPSTCTLFAVFESHMVPTYDLGAVHIETNILYLHASFPPGISPGISLCKPYRIYTLFTSCL